MRWDREAILDWISRMESRCFSDAWSGESLTDTARYEYNMIYVVYGDNGGTCRLIQDCAEAEEPCGYLVANLIAGESELLRIAVSPDCRGRGYGGALMHFYHAQTMRSCERYLLEVRESNKAARNLYERCGYHAIGTRRRYYSDPSEDGILYEYNPRAELDESGGKIIREWKG